ncbi:hypothetical protein J437_LFUL002954 [Ladona fulva]|uniref:Apical junction molecule ajm1 alpha/beta domain-containing protein n=1 Tax=Ladona fulva TaxID=123851 RepID=A0A8K0KAT0_LADFU|nr:hypothetical protein J437_LFUL002954 [Ladona fulva]
MRRKVTLLEMKGPVRDSDEEVRSVMASGALMEAVARRAAINLDLQKYSSTPNPAATLEDVLDSLLGLPPASSRSPSPASPASPSRHPQSRHAEATPHEVPAVRAPTPPPPPQQPLSMPQAREGRRRNPSHQRRARNQSRAISPPSPTQQQRILRGITAAAAAESSQEIRTPDVPEMRRPEAPEICNPEVPEVRRPDAPEIRRPETPELLRSARDTPPRDSPPVTEEAQAASMTDEDDDEDESGEKQPLDEEAKEQSSDTLRPSDPRRRRVSFETRQPSEESEADARRRRHANRKRSRAAALCRRAAAAATAPNSPALPVLSRVARQGFLSRGRGCVKIFFSGPERAEAFTSAAVRAALAGVRSPSEGEAQAAALAEIGEPAYAGWADLPLPTSGCGERCYRDLVQLCRTYDPDSKLVLLVCVCVSSAETPGAGKWSRKVVSRCTSAKLGRFRLAPEPEHHLPRRRPTDPPPPPPRRRRAAGREGAELRPGSPITREMEYPETLVLRDLPSATSSFGKRELAYGNVRKQLKRRGVSLRKQFPDVHRRLRSYVEDGTAFSPAAIHPRDGLTGRPFLCVILPEGAQEPYWDAEEGGGRMETVDLGAAVADEDEDVFPRRNSDEASDAGGGS